jgi:hypothetical protein
VIELRRRGLSVYEISTRLAAEGTPLNRTGVGQILAGEGFGRLLRGPDDGPSTSPATSGGDVLPAVAAAMGTRASATLGSRVKDMTVLLCGRAVCSG